MSRFIIDGGIPLEGTVTPSGNKNAMLPLFAATLLTDQPVILHNVPQIRDSYAMRDLLHSVGVSVTELSASSWQFQGAQVTTAELSPEMCKRIRASLLLAGPMVGRLGELVLPWPGGDVIGRRRVDTHIDALRALGTHAEYHRGEDAFYFKADKLRGADILLDEASVTATENAIMAAVLAEGTTILRNAASEPHVQELCELLNIMGAQIENIGSNMLVITGVQKLGGGEYTIGPDYLEVGSFIAASVMTKGEIRIKNAGPQYLAMTKLKFSRLGIVWEDQGADIFVPRNQPLQVVPDLDNSLPEIRAQPWPAFPSDLMSVLIVAATQASGSALFHDWMYESRMYFTDKVKKFGAQVVICDPHRCIVNGPTQLHGTDVESPDIRAGLALLLCALAAEGRSVIHKIEHIDRGYERIDEKLTALGAKIERV